MANLLSVYLTNIAAFVKKQGLWVMVLGLLLFYLQASLWFGDSNLIAYWHLLGQIHTQQQENKQDQAINNALAHKVYIIKHYQEMIENDAREKLGLIKPNESFYYIHPLSQEASAKNNAA